MTCGTGKTKLSCSSLYKKAMTKLLSYEVIKELATRKIGRNILLKCFRQSNNKNIVLFMTFVMFMVSVGCFKFMTGCAF